MTSLLVSLGALAVCLVCLLLQVRLWRQTRVRRQSAGQGLRLPGQYDRAAEETEGNVRVIPPEQRGPWSRDRSDQP